MARRKGDCRPVRVPVARCALLAGLAAATAVVVPGGAARNAPARRTAASPDAAVRVDQLGFAPAEHKVAYLLSRSPTAGAPFVVVDRTGRAVLRGRAGPSRGAWNARYRAVHALDLTRLRRPGRYRIQVRGPAETISPPFRVASPAALFRPRVADTVAFFQAQRDGRRVIPGALRRRPSHLHDRHAVVYAWPRYENADSDVILGRSLHRIAAPVDLEGGWVDAGDFIKFTHTTAYADTLLLAVRRALGAGAPASLAAETRFGLDWLDKAWDDRRGVMLIQVGIGSGNKAGTFWGDHDLWRLPERDDRLTGAPSRYLRNRPAFRANAPGQPVPPNLAGRVAAAYALAAQVDARARPARARAELETASQVFAAAKTARVEPGDIVTALPHAFYPESSWRDDLELGAAELALAGQALGDPRSAAWLRAGSRWARAYLAAEAGDDTFNLYDTSALAHADLVRAIRAAGRPGGLALGEGKLLADLRAQLRRGEARAAHDPFGAAAVYDDFDAAPHTFGLVATAELYRSLSGDRRFAGFATHQRDWALGANPWGASLMIGAGRDFPHCPQHVVANLSGSLTGRWPLLRGAVVNGPNDASLFSDGLGEFFDEGHTCPPRGGDAYSAFTGRGSRFVDDVRSWQTVEPAIDFTAAAALAFALAS